MHIRITPHFDGYRLSCIIRRAGFLNEFPLVQFPNYRAFLIDDAGIRALARFFYL
jgi:hypothetical protein